MCQRSKRKNHSSSTKPKKTRWGSFRRFLKENRDVILILVSIILTVINNFPSKKPTIQIIQIGQVFFNMPAEANLDYPPLAPCHQVQHGPLAKQPPPLGEDKTMGDVDETNHLF